MRKPNQHELSLQWRLDRPNILIIHTLIKKKLKLTWLYIIQPKNQKENFFAEKIFWVGGLSMKKSMTVEKEKIKNWNYEEVVVNFLHK